MGVFLSYCIISGSLMLAMYIAYHLFLASDKQYGFNRTVLLLIYFVSFSAPAAYFSIDIPAASPGLPASASEWTGTVPAVSAVPLHPAWGTVLIWVFLAGMAFVAVRTAFIWFRLSEVVRSGEKTEHEGYTLVVTDDDRRAPFSWMRYIVISRIDYENDFHAIAAHELKHISCRHWADLLIAQAACVINWFNPAAWLMRGELMLVHEYQADMAVIESGLNPQDYQMLLIKKAVGSRFPSLANSLNHSKLKKRITMMYREKSGTGRRVRALTLVPALALALGLTSVPGVRAAVSAIGSSGVSAAKVSENPGQDKITIRRFKVKNINNHGNETTVVIQGEGLGDRLTVSGGTFTTKGKTYRAKSLQCLMTDGTASITAKFPFTSEYENSAMTLIVDGDEIPFDLEGFFNRAQ